eukprot:TRINITY_DN2649_c0_g1_i5.p1 TRINITY_DN2649_c0_g1~~TRINITY_DN2649_c0_g1_i5.p1  ORF type:complete len:160 (+),score=16.77 TRINITY_DN2649_c0_g1_i5:43-522(+)
MSSLTLCLYESKCFKLIFFFFFNDTATTEIYTRSIVGSVRCVQETVSTQSTWGNRSLTLVAVGYVKQKCHHTTITRVVNTQKSQGLQGYGVLFRICFQVELRRHCNSLTKKNKFDEPPQQVKKLNQQQHIEEQKITRKTMSGKLLITSPQQSGATGHVG